jgi:hypothetical protein
MLAYKTRIILVNLRDTARDSFLVIKAFRPRLNSVTREQDVIRLNIVGIG